MSYPVPFRLELIVCLVPLLGFSAYLAWAASQLVSAPNHNDLISRRPFMTTVSTIKPTAAGAALPEHVDVLNALQDIQSAIKLCQQAAANDTSGSETTPAIDGVLTLALAAVERLYEQIDAEAIREAWPAAAEEVAHV
jgi:hypothetical protein